MKNMTEVMAYHYFQMIGQFFTDNYIFDKSCYSQLLEKVGYWVEYS